MNTIRQNRNRSRERLSTSGGASGGDCASARRWCVPFRPWCYWRRAHGGFRWSPSFTTTTTTTNNNNKKSFSGNSSGGNKLFPSSSSSSSASSSFHSKGERWRFSCNLSPDINSLAPSLTCFVQDGVSWRRSSPFNSANQRRLFNFYRR